MEYKNSEQIFENINKNDDGTFSLSLTETTTNDEILMFVDMSFAMWAKKALMPFSPEDLDSSEA